MKKISVVLSCIMLFASSLLASKTITGGPVITLKDQQNVQHFKTLKGANRVDAFKKIQPLIIISDGPRISQAEKMGINPTTKTDLESLLGIPDEITVGNFWVYNLKDNASACKVVFGFDKTTQVIFCTIKDCD